MTEYDLPDTMLDAALALVDEGFKVFPCCWPTPDGKCGCGHTPPHIDNNIGKAPVGRNGFKDATQLQIRVREFWTKYPLANIGVQTEGLIVPDIDARSGGFESKQALIAKFGPLPRTRVNRTGGGGEHWLYAARDRSASLVKTLPGFPGIDVKGKGGYILGPGSLHVSGNRYEVIDDAPIAVAPEWLDALSVRANPAPVAATGGNGHGEPIPSGQRDNTLASLAGSMRRRGMTSEEIFPALVAVNQRVVPPMDEADIRRIAESIGRYEPAAPVSATCYNLTDTGNAELLVGLFGDRLRFDHKRRRWLIWDGNIWQPDNTGEINRLTIESARERYRRATTIQDLQERASVSKWAIGSENQGRIESASAIAQSLFPVADSGEHWDNDPWLLGCGNGIIDLKRGELKPGKQSDRITMTTGIDFDPNAKCPRWQQFLNEVFNGDQALIDWIWRFAGYAITGDTSEQVVIMGYGTGANGKGKLNHALRQAMGDYAHDAPFSTFEFSTHASNIPNDLAALERRRFVTSSETNDGTRLNEARIKAISGEDAITARYLHQEFFTYQPACKICLFVNHKPRVDDDSFGFWRRVRLVPFTRQFTGCNDDKRLGSKLDAEGPGILAWLVRGCLEWQKRGLTIVPEAITTATEEYKVESDPLRQFIQESCVETPLAVTKSSDLYKAYVKWADDLNLRGRERLTMTGFGRRMKEQYQRLTPRDGTYYQGIGLKSCGGFDQNAVGFTPDTPKMQVIPQCNDYREETIENPPQPTTPTTESPDVPSGHGFCNGDRVATFLGRSVEDALACWRKRGAPMIHLGRAQNYLDLQVLLADADVFDWQLEAIKAWLDKNCEDTDIHCVTAT
ncbi:MAG: bifunctional DNA primase/polymerase [Chloroflexi bacterium]|nr:bifunctional DNA primase/polymerase [Chloroflexota bacterium]